MTAHFIAVWSPINIGRGPSKAYLLPTVSVTEQAGTSYGAVNCIQQRCKAGSFMTYKGAGTLVPAIAGDRIGLTTGVKAWRRRTICRLPQELDNANKAQKLVEQDAGSTVACAAFNAISYLSYCDQTSSLYSPVIFRCTHLAYCCQ